MESLELAVACAKIADERKGKDVKIVEVGEFLPITDYFVLVTCTGGRHILALCDEILKIIKKEKAGNTHVEGRGTGWWVLLDADTVVVHLFEERSREYYDLDNLWADARIVDWKEQP